MSLIIPDNIKNYMKQLSTIYTVDIIDSHNCWCGMKPAVFVGKPEHPDRFILLQDDEFNIYVSGKIKYKKIKFDRFKDLEVFIED